MTAADKLRDRNVLIIHARDEIAAALEAAENARDYAHDGDLFLRGQKCDWDEGELGPCPGCRLVEALAALNALLDGAA